jgi:hypothetical protein
MIRGAAHRGEARSSTQLSPLTRSGGPSATQSAPSPVGHLAETGLAHQFARMQTLRGA